MILDTLIAQLKHRFQHEKRARVCLWFDEKQEFYRLVPPLKERLTALSPAPFRLLEYNEEAYHGQIWVKHQIHKDLSSCPPERLENLRFVVYLPISEDRLDSPDADGKNHLELLAEFCIAGIMWRINGKRPTLFSFLRQAGVSLPGDLSEQRRLWEGGKDSLLSKYVARFFNRPREFWEMILSLGVVQSRLVGDVEKTILDLAIDPDGALQKLRGLGLEAEFFDAVRERYGLEAPTGDPNTWLVDCTSTLALTETYAGYGESADFPFLKRLPPLPIRENQLQLLRRWLRDAEARPAWDRLISEAECKLDLSSWASGRAGLSFGFPHLVKQRWMQTLNTFYEAATKLSELTDFFDKHGPSIRKEVEFARASHLPVGAWQLLDLLGRFLEQSRKALLLIEKENSAEGLARLYVKLAPQIDRQHIRIRHQALEHDIPMIGKVADRAYAEYANMLNQRFYDFLSIQEADEIGTIPGITRRLEQTFWNAAGKRALIVVDGLRFDSAFEIKDHLHAGANIKIEPMRAVLPTVTPIGMTALLPLSGRDLGIELQGNSVHPKVDGKDMAVRDNRIALLASIGADCRGIDEIEKASSPPEDSVGDLLVVFGHEELDRIGHGNGETLIRHIHIEIERLSRLIQKLHRWGYATIHVATDHGFILLDEDRLPPEVKCEKSWCHVLKERYAFAPASADLPLKSFPFTWDESLRVIVPPGTAFFKAEKSFSHGGATLQEMIIPHLVSRVQTTRTKRVGIEVVLPTFNLMRSAVKVVLRAVLPGGDKPHQMKLHEDLGRTLSLDVLRIEPSGERKSLLPDGTSKQVRLDVAKDKEISTTLFFKSSISFQQGELLDLDIRDVETGEQFPPGGIKLTVGRNM